ISTIYLPFVSAGNTQFLYWSIGLITSILFFLSVLAHEMAHSFVARRAGIGIKEVTLYVFGGLAHLEREPENAIDEFKIAIAGPTASFLVAALFYLLSLALTAIDSAGAVSNTFSKAFLHIGYVNFLLACFNMLPGFPMDGGRVLRAVIWYKKKDFNQATKVSFRTGFAIAITMILVGLYISIVDLDRLTGLWSVITGVMLIKLLQNALPQHIVGKTEQFRKPSPSILLNLETSGKKASDLMRKEFVSFQPSESIESFLRKLPQVEEQKVFPVVSSRRLHGFVSRELQTPSPQTISSIMNPVSTEQFVESDAQENECRRKLSNNGLGAIVVIDRDGYVVGFITNSDLSRKY
ncbi:MAG: site-2 protease family protein, partial [Blastocatellia bacterium]|nr:site-2 protease family protein [Blastocatellia bacterium]